MFVGTQQRSKKPSTLMGQPGFCPIWKISFFVTASVHNCMYIHVLYIYTYCVYINIQFYGIYIYYMYVIYAIHMVYMLYNIYIYIHGQYVVHMLYMLCKVIFVICVKCVIHVVYAIYKICFVHGTHI